MFISTNVCISLILWIEFKSKILWKHVFLKRFCEVFKICLVYNIIIHLMKNCHSSWLNTTGYLLKMSFLFNILSYLWAQWLSCSVLDSRPMGWGFEPHQRHCVLSLSKTHLTWLSTGSTQEDPYQHIWNIVGWDEKNQIKQNALWVRKCLLAAIMNCIITKNFECRFLRVMIKLDYIF